MKITAEPRSDQWNADDFQTGPRTFAIAGVKDGTAEQKYDIGLEGEERVWRPPLSMLRVLMGLWGDETAVWIGRRVTLYLDPTVRFGKDTPGGVRISHMSDIGDRPATVKITVSRGRKAPYAVQPLKEAPAEPARDWDALIDGCTTVEELRALYKTGADENAPQTVFEAIEKKAAALTTKDENA